MSAFRRQSCLGALCLVLALFAFSAAPASAADIAVSSTCSLANAITSSNTDAATGGCAAGSGIDTITLSANISLTATLPTITTGVTINGGGYTITSDGNRRIFDINIPYNADPNSASQRIVTINNMGLTSGSAAEGGAIKIQGGRADNLAGLTITSSTLTSNSASTNGGGAIHATNTLLVIKSSTSLSTNTAAGDGGAVYLTAGTATISGGASFSSNSTSSNKGGALYTTGSTVTISSATFSSNSAAQGGAIAIDSTTQSATVSNSTISSNTAVNEGGGIYMRSTDGGTLTLNQVTFSSNTSTNTDHENYYFHGTASVSTS